MTALSSDVNATDEYKSKEIIVHETLSDNSCTEVGKSERNIVNKILSQKNSANVSENNITEIKRQRA